MCTTYLNISTTLNKHLCWWSSCFLWCISDRCWSLKQWQASKGKNWELHNWTPGEQSLEEPTRVHPLHEIMISNTDKTHCQKQAAAPLPYGTWGCTTWRSSKPQRLPLERNSWAVKATPFDFQVQDLPIHEVSPIVPTWLLPEAGARSAVSAASGTTEHYLGNSSAEHDQRVLLLPDNCSSTSKSFFWRRKKKKTPRSYGLQSNYI